MTHHTDAERAKFEAMRAEFEAIFGPMPWGCTWTGRGYCATEYNAWNANSYSDKFDGWAAAWQAARRAPAAPAHGLTADDIKEPKDGTSWRVVWWNESCRMLLPADKALDSFQSYKNGTLQFTLKQRARDNGGAA